jgi:hypothetical protein
LRPAQHANDDDLSPAAQLAAATVSSALKEARAIQAEILRGELDDLPAAAPLQEEPWIDDLPNLLGDRDPDQCLRFPRKGHVDHLTLYQWNTGRLSWDNYVNHANSRAFEAAYEAAIHHCPGLAIFGTSDGLSHPERGREIKSCLKANKPLVVVEAISGKDDFLAVHGDTLWASAAMAVYGRGHVATAVASGRAVAVTSWDHGFLSLEASPWSPIGKLAHTPELIRSRVVPLGRGITEPLWFLQLLRMLELDSIYGPSGNAMILNGVVLGGTGAGLLPPGYAWNACVAPIAAAAGRTVARVDTQERLSTEQLHSLLLHSLLKGERLPGLVIARHELAARQFVNGVRQSPA